MPVEATEQVGPVVIWRKELRTDSGGIGKYRGGLGQHMEIGTTDGHECDIQAMFDRVNHPARGRAGGGHGAPTTIARNDGTIMKGKGKQFVPHASKVIMAFPGGAGYGTVNERRKSDIIRDLTFGYISAQSACSDYGLSQDEVAAILDKAILGEMGNE